MFMSVALEETSNDAAAGPADAARREILDEGRDMANRADERPSRAYAF
jgi:hypothetical protein